MSGQTSANLRGVPRNLRQTRKKCTASAVQVARRSHESRSSGEIKGKGGEGDVVDVAQGYAENYLFPKKLAVAATKGNLKQLEERRNNIEKREAVRIADANTLKETLEGKSVVVTPRLATRASCLVPSPLP